MLKSFKKWMLMISSFLLILTCVSPVQAAQSEGSWTFTPRTAARLTSSFEEYTAVLSGRENPTLTGVNQSYNIIFLTMSNGEAVFCVEPQMALAAGETYTRLYTGQDADQLLMSQVPTLGYSAAQLELMSQIASVGYGFNGDNSDVMRAATQLRLWQVKLPDAFSNIQSSIQKGLDTINDRLRVFSVPVSFASANLEFTGIGQSNALTLQDTSGVFKYYLNRALPQGVHITKNENELSVWIDETAAQSGTLQFYGLYAPEEANPSGNRVYYHDSNQLMGNFGKAVTPEIQISYALNENADRQSVNAQLRQEEKRSNAIELLKTDGITSAPIAGAEFELFLNDVSLGTRLTDASGRIELPVTQTKEFITANYIKEYVANFDQLSSAAKESLLAQGLYKSQSEAQQAADAQASQDLAAQVAAWKEEEAQFKAVELNAASGYFLNPEDQIQLLKTAQEGTLTFEFENLPITGRIEIIKTGESLVSSTPSTKEGDLAYTKFEYGPAAMAGAEFEVRAAEDIVYNGDTVYKKDDLVQKIVTDSAGKAVAEDLPLGNYTVQEVKAPSGYLLDSTTYDVDLTTDSKEKAVVVKSLSIANKRQKLEIDLYKTSSFDTPLAGAKFALYTAEDITIQDKTLKKGTLIEESVSDEKGQVAFVSDLPLALYEIREISAPAGFVRNEEAIAINGHFSNANQEVNKIHAVMKNDFAQIQIEVVKVDSQTKKAIMNNPAEFGVYSDEALTDQIGRLVTEEKTGSMLLSFDQPGTWYIKELNSPNGYMLSDAVIKMEVKADGTLWINDKQYEEGDRFFVENTPLTYTNTPSSAQTPSVSAKSGVLTRVFVQPMKYWIAGIGALVSCVFLISRKKRS